MKEKLNLPIFWIEVKYKTYKYRFDKYGREMRQPRFTNGKIETMAVLHKNEESIYSLDRVQGRLYKTIGANPKTHNVKILSFEKLSQHGNTNY